MQLATPLLTLLLATFVGGFAGPGAAEECSGIAADADRLACYDRSGGWVEASGRLSPGWQVTESRSELTDAPVVRISTPADTAIACSYGREAVPRLVLSCSENVTSLVLDTGSCLVTSSPFSREGEVALRVDAETVERVGFEADASNRGLVLTGARAIPVIRDLIGHDALLASFTPFQRAAVTPRFRLAGLDAAIAPLRAACGW